MENEPQEKLTPITRDEFVQHSKKLVDFYSNKLSEAEDVLNYLQELEERGDLVIKFFSLEDGSVILESFYKPRLGFLK